MNTDALERLGKVSGALSDKIITALVYAKSEGKLTPLEAEDVLRTISAVEQAITVLCETDNRIRAWLDKEAANVTDISAFAP